MTAVLVLIVVVTGLACLVATVIGHSPAGDLAGFITDTRTRTRCFVDAPAAVLAAYSSAAGATPGMRVVDRDRDSLLLDLRPTARILDGNFGMAIRVTARPDGERTTVHTEANHKVRWALCNDDAALRSAEMALRARAKRAGIREVF